MLNSPEMGMNTPEIPKVENVDQYEREKIERTLKDAEHLVEVIKNYLEMVKFCDENEIYAEERTSLERLRRSGQPAGPNNDLNKLSIMFQNGQIEIEKYLADTQKAEIKKRISERNENKLPKNNNE